MQFPAFIRALASAVRAGFRVSPVAKTAVAAVVAGAVTVLNLTGDDVLSAMDIAEVVIAVGGVYGVWRAPNE